MKLILRTFISVFLAGILWIPAALAGSADAATELSGDGGCPPELLDGGTLPNAGYPVSDVAWAFVQSPLLTFGSDQAEGVQDDGPKRKCRERSSCCKVCGKGKACGNSCIRADYNCRKARSCSRNASEIC